ncbi:MAG: glucose-6-phosphate isomerase [Deltaproteobacteria bacterium]|nr:glucose-6-phosphate isomerase [Deltaproteobacteria bacterium]
MSANPWDRFCRQLCEVPALGLSVDPSLAGLDEPFLAAMAAPLARAFDEMEALERGAIANADEKRMVGHYWLRAPGLAPTPEIAREIGAALKAVKAFARAVHARKVKPQRAPAFRRLLCVGIGGSALGPMFVADALGRPGKDRLQPEFLDNTDPDGFARAFARLGPALRETLVVVTSKSGGTPETRNGLLAAQAAFRAGRLDFARHAVAITQAGSAMDVLAVEQGWLARFPMWDWVGGRTSELSAVGLLPAALQGLDVSALLAGAAACDEATRLRDPFRNPAALLALCWFRETAGQGNRAMVVLPYKDRLLLFSRYLQQLVMESLGKRLDREGRRADQGISVYGNKGSTDQHAYVQQLRDGVHDFFAVLLRVRASGGKRAEVEPGVTAGDYLHGFLLGTRAALAENGRRSITLSVPEVDARTVGALIALFERAVGLYASLVGVNAYHQPGVEAGKKAAAGVLALQRQVEAALSKEPATAAGLAARVGSPDVEAVWLLLEHLAANGRARQSGSGPLEARFASAGKRAK